ncbi:CBS domain-containing protein [Aeromicrobium flavum]|uniref:CBS domain-containing protein n=1 Tax=Aeromicrobium flavum TaxID=416568 RepID=UPI0027D95EBD|nr:CBS domain-containing protein [Aeromicrobium flavum]
MFTIAPDATVDELLDRLTEYNIGALVVSPDGRSMAGIVSERDVVRKLRDVPDPRAATVQQIMTTDVQVCSPEDSFGALMSAMTEHRVRHIPVLENEEIVGVLSIGDAVKFRMDQLEFERDQLTHYVQS